LNRVRVLILDRQRDHADTLRMLFESRGCVVLSAEDSHNALALIAVHHPDALIIELDILGASSVCAAARESNRLGAFVVGIAGVNLDASPCDVRLVKPYDFEALMREMESFLDKRAEERRSASGGPAHS
jgi:DNA-binding response OmpR family regulator